MITGRASFAIAGGFGLLLVLSAACGADPMQAPGPVGQAGTPAPAAASGGVTGSSAGTGASAGMGASAGSSAPSGSGAGGGGTGGSGNASAGSGGVAAMASSGGAGAIAGASGSAGGSAPAADTIPTLYWLDINTNRVMRSRNFEDGEVIVSRTGTAPDGVAVDVAGGKLYWTNMGSLFGTGGGSLQRANLDGTGVETIIPAGTARTPKQMQVDLINRHVYFCDREGAKVWRAGMDGSQPEAIVSEHGFRELVGIALDIPGGKFYFSDRIGRKILRANIAMPAGQTGANRTDIEELFVFGSNAMPIDLDIDHEHRKLYWTDRDLGTVHRANLDIPTGQTAMNRTDSETLVEDLVDTIGISLDVPNDKMYFSELGGQISAAALDGSGLKRDILSSTSATGVAIAYIPKP